MRSLGVRWACGEAQAEKSVFHGKAEKDFAGRSWLEPPKDKRAENEFCYLPKRWIHTWSGHTKARAPLFRAASPHYTTLPRALFACCRFCCSSRAQPSAGSGLEQDTSVLLT